jgi:hypothetical protein
MTRYITHTIVALFATIAVSIAAMPDNAAMEAGKTSAWQAFKDKNSDAFKKVVDKDIRCVYANRLSTSLQDELVDMQKWDMKSFEFSDFDMFSDEKDVIVTTYKVKVQGQRMERMSPAPTTPGPSGNWRTVNGSPFSIPT